MIGITFFAPYLGLRSVIEKVLDERPDRGSIESHILMTKTGEIPPESEIPPSTDIIVARGFTAQLAKAFGCEVLGFNRSPRQIEGVRMTDLDTLLSECDIVSLHVPLTDETRGLIGERELSLMKPDAVLINTARGPVVDSRALAAALKEGRLAGAAVDVYETEPPIAQDHPLLTAPNVTATPHVAFATKEALYQRAAIVFDNVAGYLDGKPQNVM